MFSGFRQWRGGWGVLVDIPLASRQRQRCVAGGDHGHQSNFP